MNYGPLEFAAYLQRKETGQDESAAVRAARDAAPEPRPRGQPAHASCPGRSDAAPLARDAQVEAVSVYEAVAIAAAGAIAPARSACESRRAWRPDRAGAVLASDRALADRARRGRGAAAVLLAGCGESTVAGARQVPVSSIGGFYAFKRGSAEFKHLEDEVLRCTGCGIENFQSVYAGIPSSRRG